MMHEKMKKMMGKKKDGKLSPVEKDAKSSVLKDLSDSAADMMKEKLGGLKKVSVAAPSKSGLQEGLKLAEKLTEKMPEKSGMDEAGEQEEEMVADAEDGHGMEGEEAEEAAEEEGEEKSKEELLAEIERLKAKIEKMS